MHEREHCRRAAPGLDLPTVLIENGGVFTPFTGEFMWADVALSGSRIAGVGHYRSWRSRIVGREPEVSWMSRPRPWSRS